MATERTGYSTREARDAEWTRLRQIGTKHVTRYTDQIDGKMVYVLAVPQTILGAASKLIAENANLDLTDSVESESMVSEGSPDV